MYEGMRIIIAMKYSVTRNRKNFSKNADISDDLNNFISIFDNGLYGLKSKAISYKILVIR